MPINVFNTLTNKKEEFKPQKEGFVSMYVCGITPYDEVHLGHARAYVVFDIIKRHLLKRKYKVTHIQNFTDVDDKIIKRANERNMSPIALAQKYIDDYFAQTDKLNILKADQYPKVTQTIAEIIDFIKKLIEKGFAYEKNGDVYYSVEQFKDYGKLSKRHLEDMQAGARVEVNDEKKSPFDFALWKKSKEDEPNEVCWDSPWGKGRPGWHIECSVMSSTILGDTIDIHGGGQDLIFPHHENEIAQSEAKSGKQFVKYWIHNGFVTINKEKMSKSLNNFFTLSEILKKYDPRVVRYYLLTQHYKSPLDFSDLGLEAAKTTLQGVDDAYFRLVQAINGNDNSSITPTLPSPLKGEVNKDKVNNKDIVELKEKFYWAMDDDFNSEKALSYLHELKNIILNELFKADIERLELLKNTFEEFLDTSLGISIVKLQNTDSDMETLLKERNEARKTKNWAEADRLRKLIDEKGYKIIDNPDGSAVLTKKI